MQGYADSQPRESKAHRNVASCTVFTVNCKRRGSAAPMPSPAAWVEGPPQVITRISLSELHRISRKPVTEGFANKSDSSSATRANGSVTADEISTEGSKPGDTDAHEHLIEGKDTQHAEHERYVKWGIPWKTPLLIVLWALVGFSLAIGHHLYYQSLDGTKAGSSSRQS